MVRNYFHKKGPLENEFFSKSYGNQSYERQLHFGRQQNESKQSKWKWHLGLNKREILKLRMLHSRDADSHWAFVSRGTAHPSLNIPNGQVADWAKQRSASEEDQADTDLM